MYEVTSYMYLFLALACAIAIVVRFRGTPVAVLGGITFGTMTAVSLLYKVLPALKLNLQNYYIGLNLVNIVAWGCLLAALITARVHVQAEATAGKLVATQTGGRGPQFRKYSSRSMAGSAGPSTGSKESSSCCHSAS